MFIFNTDLILYQVYGWGQGEGMRYWIYLPGVMLYAGVYLWQRRRLGSALSL